MDLGGVGGPPDQGRLAVPGGIVGQRIEDEGARIVVLGHRQVATVARDADHQVDVLAEALGVFQRDRGGGLDRGLLGLGQRRGVAGLPLDVLVAAIEGGGLQGVGRRQLEAQLDVPAIGHVVIVGPERPPQGLGVLASVVPREQAVLEGVPIEPRLQPGVFGDLGAGQQGDAVDVPIGPGPVAGAGRVGDVERRVLRTLLTGEGQRIVITLARREADLGVDPPVLAVGVVAIAAILQRRRAIAVRQRPVGALVPRARQLSVEVLAAAADPARNGGAVQRTVGVETAAQPHLALERRLGRAGHQVDGAADAPGAVEHRDITLRDLNLGQVGRQEAGEVDTVVGRQEDPHAVDRQGGLEAVEAPDKDEALIARAAAVAGVRAGDQVQRLVDADLVELAQVLGLDLRPADQAAVAATRRDPHLTQFVDVAVVRRGGGLSVGDARQQRAGEQDGAKKHGDPSLCRLTT